MRAKVTLSVVTVWLAVSTITLAPNKGLAGQSRLNQITISLKDRSVLRGRFDDAGSNFWFWHFGDRVALAPVEGFVVVPDDEHPQKAVLRGNLRLQFLFGDPVTPTDLVLIRRDHQWFVDPTWIQANRPSGVPASLPVQSGGAGAAVASLILYTIVAIAVGGSGLSALCGMLSLGLGLRSGRWWPRGFGFAAVVLGSLMLLFEFLLLSGFRPGGFLAVIPWASASGLALGGAGIGITSLPASPSRFTPTTWAIAALSTALVVGTVFTFFVWGVFDAVGGALAAPLPSIGIVLVLGVVLGGGTLVAGLSLAKLLGARLIQESRA